MNAAQGIAPRIATFELRDLAEGRTEELEKYESFEAQRFSRGDVSGRDLSGIAFDSCVLENLNAHEASLRGATLLETVIEGLNAPVLSAARASLRDVVIRSSRLGSAELYDSALSSVRISDSKLGYLNFRGAQVRDVLFERCTVDELDLGAATVTRVAFSDTSVRSLNVRGSTLAQLDLRGADISHIEGIEGLRGAIVSTSQLALLSDALAAHIGLIVSDAP